MKSKIAGIGIAVAFATLFAAGPSFGQFGGGGGSAPAAAPSGGSFGGGGGAPQQNAAPRGGGNRGAVSGGGGNRGAFVGGGGTNRQAFGGRDRGGYRGGHRGGYRGYGYGAGVVIGTTPFWGAPAYGYDDDYYVDAPAAGGDVAYCMRRFRSYDPRSGTYLGNDGYRHACP
jgi:hypothetical protein